MTSSSGFSGASAPGRNDGPQRSPLKNGRQLRKISPQIERERTVPFSPFGFISWKWMTRPKFLESDPFPGNDIRVEGKQYLISWNPWTVVSRSGEA